MNSNEPLQWNDIFKKLFYLFVHIFTNDCIEKFSGMYIRKKLKGGAGGMKSPSFCEIITKRWSKNW